MDHRAGLDDVDLSEFTTAYVDTESGRRTFCLVQIISLPISLLMFVLDVGS
jgi:hypothetical protein